MIGTALTNALISKGYSVIILTRKLNPKTQKAQNISYAQYDVDKQTIEENAVRSADFIIHLAGANVAEKRWTKKRKKEIIDSRVKTGELIVNTLRKLPNHVKAVLSSSAIGYYGADAEIPSSHSFIETEPAANDFLGNVVQQWERAIQPASELTRLVIFRTGIVLSKAGGAYVEFKKPFRFRIATILGNGKQVISWIHIDDLVRLYIEAIENEKWNGIYNAVAPKPVNNSEMIRTIGRITGNRYIPIRVPRIALKLVLGELSTEVLKSATVSSEKIQHNGFRFSYPDLASAVKSLENTDNK